MLCIIFLIADFQFPIGGTQSALASIKQRRRRPTNRQSAISNRQYIAYLRPQFSYEPLKYADAQDRRTPCNCL